jgi:hypothetical protein
MRLRQEDLYLNYKSILLGGTQNKNDSRLIFIIAGTSFQSSFINREFIIFRNGAQATHGLRANRQRGWGLREGASRHSGRE